MELRYTNRKLLARSKLTLQQLAIADQQQLDMFRVNPPPASPTRASISGPSVPPTPSSSSHDTPADSTVPPTPELTRRPSSILTQHPHYLPFLFTLLNSIMLGHPPQFAGKEIASIAILVES